MNHYGEQRGDSGARQPSGDFAERELRAAKNKSLIGLILGAAAIVMGVVSIVLIGNIRTGATSNVALGMILCNLSVVLAVFGTVLSVGARKTLAGYERGLANAAMAVGIVAVVFTAIFSVASDLSAGIFYGVMSTDFSSASAAALNG